MTEPVRTLDGDTLVLVHSNDNPDRRADVDGLTPPQYVGLAINAGSQSREVFVNTNFSKVDSGLYQLSTHTDAGSTARPKFMEVEVVKFQQDLVNKLSSTPEAARPAIRQPANVR
ncbi:MAG: hypothetical protein ACREHC_05345 [Candidatus Levyibacteriota bacterium]